MQEHYDPKQIEQKWQQYWLSNAVYKTDDKLDKPKKYILDMFPYPSGDGLHVGHVEGYTASDILARYMRMKGFNVLHPIGWDAFGLPAENYAIKKGVHPQETTAKNIINFKQQINNLGLSYDWDREINTSSPEYYKWTQWLFGELFKAGLAYQKEASVNWCEHDQTVLANEQVVDGKCERCSNPVTQKNMKQWFFTITDYAEDLLTGLDDLNWPNSIKTSQRNWIGKSEGAEVEFSMDGSKRTITVFTTRPDTLFGATYLVLAPEHELLKEIVTKEQQSAVKKYQEQAAKKSELLRTQLQKEKTGIFTGAYAINPVNGDKLPIWVADYVVSTYGTGAIMAVPAHDERDFEFATKYKLPIIKVVDDEVDPTQAITKITDWLKDKKCGNRKTTYRLRDWLISRQRYWGAPIPIIHCEQCGPVLVDQKDLPVELPTDVDFNPHGHSPLADSKDFINAKCPKCGAEAVRETDTMDTFVCSSWYYLRYVSPQNNKQAFDPEKVEQWLPADIYIGGAEHAVLHLLYARFITKFLHDQKLLSFDEPFTSLKNVGIILGPDHRKMSKSLGNVINPDDVIAEYGADTLRLHEMFMGPFSDEKPWNTDSIKGVYRLLENVWRLVTTEDAKAEDDSTTKLLHQTIAKVGKDTEEYRFNTAIAALMSLVGKVKSITKEQKKVLVLILSPYAPHMTSELWEYLQGEKLDEQVWPDYDKDNLVDDEVVIAVQVNGKLRGEITVDSSISEDEVKELAKQADNVKKHLTSKNIVKEIYVPNKIVNIVVKD